MRTGIHAKWWCNQIPSTKSDSSSLLGHDKMGLRIHWDMEQDNLSGYSRLWTSHWDITNMFIFNRQPHTIEASGYRWRGEVTTCTDPPQSNTAGTLPSMCTHTGNSTGCVRLQWVSTRRDLTSPSPHFSVTEWGWFKSVYSCVHILGTVPVVLDCSGSVHVVTSPLPHLISVWLSEGDSNQYILVYTYWESVLVSHWEWGEGLRWCWPHLTPEASLSHTEMRWGRGEVTTCTDLTAVWTQPVLFPVCVHKNILIWITLTQSHWNEVRLEVTTWTHHRLQPCVYCSQYHIPDTNESPLTQSPNVLPC